jgi:hypothetical protein
VRLRYSGGDGVVDVDGSGIDSTVERIIQETATVHMDDDDDVALGQSKRVGNDDVIIISMMMIQTRR